MKPRMNHMIIRKPSHWEKLLAIFVGFSLGILISTTANADSNTAAEYTEDNSYLIDDSLAMARQGEFVRASNLIVDLANKGMLKHSTFFQCTSETLTL